MTTIYLVYTAPVTASIAYQPRPLAAFTQRQPALDLLFAINHGSKSSTAYIDSLKLDHCPTLPELRAAFGCETARIFSDLQAFTT